MLKTTMADHQDAVKPHHRFTAITAAGLTWTFEHLDAFVFKHTLEMKDGTALDLDVVVLFENHCFTREPLPGEDYAQDLVVMDGRQVRILDSERYALSKAHLPRLVEELPKRHIQVADPTRPSFVTMELPGQPGDEPQRYAMFFEVKKDAKRKKRLLLRVQSAYLLESPSKRLLKADKMRFEVILKRAYGA